MTTTPCPRCRGSGKTTLAPCLLDTLDLLTHSPLTPAECQQAHPIGTRNAWNWRLEQLRAMGLVRRHRDGREWRYTL